MIDAGEDRDVGGADAPAGSLQGHESDVGLTAGEVGLLGARVGGVGVEADMGIDGGSHAGGPVFRAGGRALGSGHRHA